MNFVRTEIGFARRILTDFFAQSLEFTAPSVSEILARGRSGRTLVEINRNLQLAANSLSKPAAEGDAVFHRRAFERNEGHDIGGTDPGVLTTVLAEVDALRGRFDA